MGTLNDYPEREQMQAHRNGGNPKRVVIQSDLHGDMKLPKGAHGLATPVEHMWFWNIAYFDEPYFNGLFETFVFPDGSMPNWDSLNWLQKEFMKWFNAERLKAVITFPVETMNLLNDGKEFVDKSMADFAAEMYSKGHSFFTYTSDSVDSLAS